MIRLPDKIQGKVEDVRVFFRPYATETTPAKVEALRVFYGPELVAEAHEEGYVVLSAPEAAVLDKHHVNIFCKVWRQP